jgi:hypothetical protein
MGTFLNQPGLGMTEVTEGLGHCSFWRVVRIYKRYAPWDRYWMMHSTPETRARYMAHGRSESYASAKYMSIQFIYGNNK